MRTPNSFHSNGWVVEFVVKKKEIFYNVLKWNKQGTTQSLIKSAKYNGEKPQSLLTELINGDANLEAQK